VLAALLGLVVLALREAARLLVPAAVALCWRLRAGAVRTASVSGPL
jgi:hypothetical protein